MCSTIIATQHFLIEVKKIHGNQYLYLSLTEINLFHLLLMILTVPYYVIVLKSNFMIEGGKKNT